MKFSKKIELAINNAGWGVEDNALTHYEYRNCGIVLSDDTDDANVADSLRHWLDLTNEDICAREWIMHLIDTEWCPNFSAAKVAEDAKGTIEEAMDLLDILDSMTDAEGYCFAVHCNENATPAEDIEVFMFQSEEERDTFISNEAWSYEAVNNVTEINAGPFWDWLSVKGELAEFGNPARANWIYGPKMTEAILTIEEG